MGIPFGDDPGWVRVTRDPNPLAAITEMVGQVLDPRAFLGIGNGNGPNGLGSTNAFITYTDNTFTHYGRDFNVFLTLDLPYRHFLADGNFEQYDEDVSLQEYASIEIEWERGALASFAVPAIGDRLRVFGPLIYDCGHGDDGGEPQGLSYRTEIHPPVGWVIYRQTADADGVPQGNKAMQNPWIWYEPTASRHARAGNGGRRVLQLLRRQRHGGAERLRRQLQSDRRAVLGELPFQQPGRSRHLGMG
jgi:hypothetical protein